MYKQHRILAIIPARGGSKGVPRKNIRPLAGKPLIAWTIEAAQQSSYLDRCVLSSEDAEIMQVARDFGCDVPFPRPAELAQDDTPGIAPVMHVLDTLAAQGEVYDYVLLLQPTSPLRQSQHIDDIIKTCLDKNADSSVSVYTAEPHPYWSFTRNDAGYMQPLFDEIPVRRQDLPAVYALNGALYLSCWQQLKDQQNFISTHTLPYIMSARDAADIDTELDFNWCEFLIQQTQTKAG